MDIKKYIGGPFQTNTYLILSNEEAAVVDPTQGSFDFVSNWMNKDKRVLTKILLTHSHWDHIIDVVPLKNAFKPSIFIHPLDAPNLENPGADGLPCWINIQPVKPDVLIRDGSSFLIGGEEFKVIHTPGHSPGSVCFFSPKNNILFSGDTLFKNSIGNLSFPTSQPDMMWNSLEKLAKLPENVEVYPGHGPSTFIGKEHWLSRAKEIFGS